MSDSIRFGILSTASINSYGFIPFAEMIEGCELAAIASRDAGRAAEYARKHDIPRSYGSYEELLADPDINCVYIPLPSSMHAAWSIKALEAGKHVLCEKPATTNAADMERVRDKVRETGLIYGEAFHNRYHPLTEKVLEVVREGEIGELKSIDVSFSVILLDRSKVQFKPEMGGGALLDLGCYPVSFARWVAGSEGVEVEKAWTIKAPGGGVDLVTNARLKFDNGVTARVFCSFLQITPEVAVIRGTKGMITFVQYIHPVHEVGGVSIGAYILISAGVSGLKSIRISSKSTYNHQLEAFCEAVRSGVQPVTGPDEALANMRLLDAIAEKAGIVRSTEISE